MRKRQDVHNVVGVVHPLKVGLGGIVNIHVIGEFPLVAVLNRSINGGTNRVIGCHVSESEFNDVDVREGA